MLAQDGHYWITGRVDDVINVSGHRIGTAEVESAVVLHPQVTKAIHDSSPDYSLTASQARWCGQ